MIEITDDKHPDLPTDLECKRCGHPRWEHHRGAGSCGYCKITGTGCDTDYDDCLCGIYFPVDQR